MPTRYGEDFYRWSQETAQALAEGRIEDVDLEHVAEKIRDLGASQRRELISRLTIVVLHMLKSAYQPERRSRSWERTIREQRRELGFLLEANPSLQAEIYHLLPTAYRHAFEKRAAKLKSRERHFPANARTQKPRFSVMHSPTKSGSVVGVRIPVDARNHSSARTMQRQEYYAPICFYWNNLRSRAA